MRHFIAVIQRVKTSYIARCMELGIAGQGDTPEEAREGGPERGDRAICGGYAPR